VVFKIFMDSKIGPSLKKSLKKLHKRNRALNVVKAGAKRTYKGFQKIRLVLDKVNLILDPRKALFGFIFLSCLKPSSALAFEMPNPIPIVNGLKGWVKNYNYCASPNELC